jgi:hypothetical protein
MMTCPHEDRAALAADYLAGRLPEGRAEEFEAHYFACDACFEQVELAASLHAAFQRRPRAAARRATRTWALAAAAMLAVAVAGVWLVRFPGGAPVEDRVLRGDGASFAVKATLGEAELVLEWPAVDGAHQYEARVFDAEGGMLWERRTDVPRVVVPRSELPAVAGAGELFASVDALDALLQPVARSSIARVRTGTDVP